MSDTHAEHSNVENHHALNTKTSKTNNVVDKENQEPNREVSKTTTENDIVKVDTPKKENINGKHEHVKPVEHSQHVKPVVHVENVEHVEKSNEVVLQTITTAVTNESENITTEKSDMIKHQEPEHQEPKHNEPKQNEDTEDTEQVHKIENEEKVHEVVVNTNEEVKPTDAQAKSSEPKDDELLKNIELNTQTSTGVKKKKSVVLHKYN